MKACTWNTHLQTTSHAKHWQPRWQQRWRDIWHTHCPARQNSAAHEEFGDTSPMLLLSQLWTWLCQGHTCSTGDLLALISKTGWTQEKWTVVLAGTTPLWQLLQHSIFLNRILQDSPNMHLTGNQWAMDGSSAPESLLERGSKGS